jgi:hypothetical protein
LYYLRDRRGKAARIKEKAIWAQRKDAAKEAAKVAAAQAQ